MNKPIARRAFKGGPFMFPVNIAVIFSIFTASCSTVPVVSPSQSPSLDSSPLREVMVFGATGKVGGGIYQALLEDPSVEKIHVATRRITSHLREGMEQGKVEIAMHSNFLDYNSLSDKLSRVQAVYWAIGASARNVGDDEYVEIHVDFPVALVQRWLAIDPNKSRSFHLITGSGTSKDSWFHWARTKAQVEQKLTAMGENTGLRFISYRPAVVIPTEQTVRDGRDGPNFLVRWLFSNIEAKQIGQCMIEATARGAELSNGTILSHESINLFAKTYRSRFGGSIPDKK